MSDASTKPTLTNPLELKSEPACRLWHALVTAGTTMGLSEGELLKKSGMSQEYLLAALFPHLTTGVITHRFQQIGTGGTSVHFYTLKVPCKIMVVPTPPPAP